MGIKELRDIWLQCGLRIYEVKTDNDTVKVVKSISNIDTNHQGVYMVSAQRKLVSVMYGKLYNADGTLYSTKTKGTTSERPTGVNVGFIYKDTDLNKLIVWDGEAWINMDGTTLNTEATQADETTNEVTDSSEISEDPT